MEHTDKQTFNLLNDFYSLQFLTGLKYEDFNVYGIHGAGGESDSPPDGPENLSFPTGPSQR